MRIIKCEKIFLSQDEFYTWSNFNQILGELEEKSESSDTRILVRKIQNLLDDLWEGIEGLDELRREVEDIEQ